MPSSSIFFRENNIKIGSILFTDGTDFGTTIVADLNSVSYSNFIAVGNTLFLTVTNGSGNELWKSDGTATGTTMVKDIYPGATGSGITVLAAIGSMLFFEANDGTYGYELWKSDGTLAGTAMVKDISLGGNANINVHVAVLNDQLIFSPDDGPHSYELWKSEC